MKIQDFSNLVAKMAKIDDKRCKVAELDANLESIDNMVDTDLWLDTYDRLQAAKRSLKKAYAEFRKDIESNEETAHYAADFAYSYDQSDKNFFYIVKWNILKQSQHIEFSENKF